MSKLEKVDTKTVINKLLEKILSKDNMNIAFKRVMENITRFIETKLRLKVNKDKSKVDRPWRIKYLGFSYYQAKVFFISCNTLNVYICA